MVTETAQYSALHCFFNFKQNDEYLLISNTLRFICSILLAFAFYFILHIARHSFANIARQKNANVYDISNALGHSDIKVTEAYLSQFDYQSQDKTMAMVFDSSKEDSNKEELIRLIQNMKADEIESLIKQAKR